MTRKKLYTSEQTRIRDSRFHTLKCNLNYLAYNFPRSKVLYPLMDRPIYQDFETLIASAIEDCDPINDNDQS